MVYGLLIGKSVSDDNRFFERVIEENNFNPDSILIDFESGTIKSVESLFPLVVHKGNNNMSFIRQWITSTFILILGCLFHFSQCICRNIHSHGLQNKYQPDESFHLKIKNLIALAFVSSVDVIKVFELVVDDFTEGDTDESLITSKKHGLENERREMSCPGDLIRRPDRLGSDRNSIGFYANFRQTDEFLKKFGKRSDIGSLV